MIGLVLALAVALVLLRFSRAIQRGMRGPEFRSLCALVFLTLAAGIIFYREVEEWSVLATFGMATSRLRPQAVSSSPFSTSSPGLGSSSRSCRLWRKLRWRNVTNLALCSTGVRGRKKIRSELERFAVGLCSLCKVGFRKSSEDRAAMCEITPDSLKRTRHENRCGG